ncbi:DUF4328 domain-containing protein [Streptacidiphilus anmyonensis]|uniref:DUF4328 domain-containing protein n=1 Tax=Streptacidiphilus anmyonensis TaxID=405782 RepID=UPI00069334C8|nr:DUF4328 domain-containing protein [Streptacidiphilus anmyonensis]
MLCPSCSAATLDAYGRCPHCGYLAAPPAQPYAAYYPQPAMISPTAPAGIGLAAQILIAVSGVLALVSFGLNIWAYTVAKAGPGGILDANTNLNSLDAVAGIAGILALFNLLLGLATGIVFIVWFFKSANLAAILAPGRQALSAGWAIGGWFIPLGWFVLPRVVAGGVWRAAIPLQSQPVLRKPRTYLVTWWWLSFCVGETMLSTPVSASARTLNSSGSLLVPYGASGFGDLCRVASAILGIVMIRKLTQMQQIRILQGPGVGHPYAAPVIANAPYAAYAEPAPAPFGVSAPIPGQVGPYGPTYGPTTGTPYAPSYPQDAQPLPQPAPQAGPQPGPQPGPQAGYTASVPPQAAPPTQETLPPTLAEPVAAQPVVEPATEPLPAAEAAPEDAVPTLALTDAVPEDTVPKDAPTDVPTTVLPRQSQDHATVRLTPVAAPAQDPEPVSPDPAVTNGTIEGQEPSTEPREG